MKPLLYAVSHFSLLRGVLSPDMICRTALELGYSSVAIADRNNLYGLPEFLRCCEEHGLTPIVAAEMSGPDGTAVLYADGDAGFSNLCRIISQSHCDDSFNLVAAIRSDSRGIHAVTADTGLIWKLRDFCEVYFMMQRPRVPPQQVRKEGIPCLIAPMMAFTCDQDRQTHRMLRAIDINGTLSGLPRSELFDSAANYLSWKQLEERFEVFDYAIEATISFVAKIRSRTKLLSPVMPVFSSEKSSVDTLRRRTFEGAKTRYGELNDVIVKRIEYELELICKKGFSDYFLVVDDIVKQSPRTCGRGSGAASIVAYSLGITNVDPIRYNLMFERFLNPGRTDPPDIDVDFAWDERDSVLDYVFDKYGKAHVAMIATHQTCGARMAIREVARVYGLTEDEISRVTSRIPYFVDLPEYAASLQDVLKQWPSMQNMVFDHPWPAIFNDAGRIIGMPRGIGTHCGGVVITPQPINTAAPVQISAKGYPIVQWEKDGAEEMGLVKIDLLGNRSLAVIRDTLENIKREGIIFDQNRWDPQSDKKTVDLFASGDTMGVFYTESPAMRLLQRKTRAGDFDHLVIHSSIIRPAANKYIREYIKRLHGAQYKVPHPVLRETLSETFGIMVYQEDVSRVAMSLAGFSAEDADALRKIMSKKAKGKRFEDFRIKFFQGARKNGASEDAIDEIWKMMLSFCGYSFCKPHSASYVQVSFQSAYLKAHFPAAFMAAVLSNYGGYYSTQAYISESQRMGLKVISPDVNQSEYRYYSRGDSIIVGFCQIKGLGIDAQERIIENRRKHGIFTGIEDLLSRTGIGESDAEKLILAGACDNMCRGVNRSQQFWQMRRFFRSGKNEITPGLKTLSVRQYLISQYRMLGFLSCCHPVTLIRCKARGLIKAVDIEKNIGRRVTILGWCITSKTVSTKMGEAMEFVTFEDETGLIETVFFPDIYKKSASILEHHSAFLVSGRVTEEFGVAILEVSGLQKPS